MQIVIMSLNIRISKGKSFIVTFFSLDLFVIVGLDYFEQRR